MKKSNIELGYVSLIDCAPLVAAREKGFFEKHGLEVNLVREPSWANIRDKVAFGSLDGAQMLAGMPIATSLGVGTWKKPTITALSLGLNGNAITVSNSLYEELQRMRQQDSDDASYSSLLQQCIEQRKASGQPLLRFAHVFNVSMHHYLLRYWLASAGIDPDRDLQLIVIPPAQMVENMKAGTIDGFCVGDPWNSLAMEYDIGKTIISGYDIWNNAPEKVLGVNQEWAERYPETHLAMVRAVVEAAAWCDDSANHEELTDIFVSRHYIDLQPGVIRQSLSSEKQYGSHVFNRFAANFPWRSHAMWIISQMYRWGQLAEPCNIRNEAEKIYRPDIYRQAVSSLDLSSPDVDYKEEGLHAGNWAMQAGEGSITLAADRFIDESIFNPEDPVQYIATRLAEDSALDISELSKCNCQF